MKKTKGGEARPKLCFSGLQLRLDKLQPLGELTALDGLARALEESAQLVHIVVVQEHLREDLVAQVQVVDVGAGVVAAPVARAASQLNEQQQEHE